MLSQSMLLANVAGSYGVAGGYGDCCPPRVCKTRCWETNRRCCRTRFVGPRWRFCSRQKPCCAPRVRCCQPACAPGGAAPVYAQPTEPYTQYAPEAETMPETRAPMAAPTKRMR